jgi:two-component system sensor histidine kinase YesM
MAYSRDLLKMIELRFNDLAVNMNGLSMQLLSDNRIYNVLSSISNESDVISSLANTNVVLNMLRDATLSRNEIQSICVADKNGRLLTYDTNSTKVIRHIIPYKDVLNQAREFKGEVLWYLDKKGFKVENVFVTRTIYDRDSFEEVGLIVIWIKKDFLESMYRDLSSESTKNITIVSTKNEEIISAAEAEDVNINTLSSKNSFEGDRGTFTDKKSNMMISYISLKEPNWKIIYHVSLDYLHREIEILRKWIYIILFSGLVILSVLSILTALDIVNPINKLVEGMRSLEIGIEYKEINLNRNDELGYVSKSFNRMAAKIDNLVRRIYREELTRKEAQIKALQAQINPHFLYNTLENINWMAQLNGVPEISETVTALASIIDANIGRDDKLISLREEFQYIENYISIIKNRYGARLEILKDINEKAMDISIPKLLIQPLVENAVYHGIEKSLRKGIIKLKVYDTVSHIIIEVEDNGLGMTTEDLETINRRLIAEEDALLKNEIDSSKRRSIGLENVNMRIRLFYGSNHGIKLESVYDEYTRVIVKIPKNTENMGGYDV